MKRTASPKLLHRTIDSQIEIDAKPEIVWQALTDLTSWETWNVFIPKAEGTLKVGERIRIEVVLPDTKPMVFRPKVSEVVKNKKILWGSGLPAHLFRGEHEFLLEPVPMGKTLFRQVERFAGPLVVFMNSTLKKTKEGHHRMNLALKKHVENK